MAKLNMNFYHKCFIITILLIHECVGPPAKVKEPGKDNHHDNSSSSDNVGNAIDDYGLEYGRYLKEVVETLESDAEFRKKLENAAEIDFRSGKVAAELEYVNHNVRSKLDELKRSELQRLKQLVKQSDQLERQQQKGHHDIVGHLDHINEQTFEVADLHKLITKVRLDLEEADKRRKQEFKEYEMQKKFEIEQKMKTMDDEHKKKYMEELEQQKKKHQQHEPIHHPGSKAQLEEVWEKEDHMENQKFNPKAFFHLHDLDGNGYWDEEEVKALFVKEVEKLYEAGAPEDDLRDRQEEMERMREHMFEESDTNRDRLISYAEFLAQTKKQDFERDEGWESIDQRPQFTQQEYEEFERRRQQEIQRLIEQGLLQPYAPGMMPPPQQQYAVHPAHQQQHPGQMGYNMQPPHHSGVQQMPQQYHQYGGQVQQQMPGNPIHHQQGQMQQVQYHAPVGQVPQQVQYQQHPNQIPQLPQAPPPQQYQQTNNIQQQQPPQYQQHPPQPNNIPQHQQAPQAQQQSNNIPQQQQQQYQQPPPQYQQQQSNNIPNQQPQISQQGNNIPQQAPQYQQKQQQSNNIPQQPPQYQQQQQSNNIPQQPQQYQQPQSKYEPHGNKVESNDKIKDVNVPK